MIFKNIYISPFSNEPGVQPVQRSDGRIETSFSRAFINKLFYWSTSYNILFLRLSTKKHITEHKIVQSRIT